MWYNNIFQNLQLSIHKYKLLICIMHFKELKLKILRLTLKTKDMRLKLKLIL